MKIALTGYKTITKERGKHRANTQNTEHRDCPSEAQYC